MQSTECQSHDLKVDFNREPVQLDQTWSEALHQHSEQPADIPRRPYINKKTKNYNSPNEMKQMHVIISNSKRDTMGLSNISQGVNQR